MSIPPLTTEEKFVRFLYTSGYRGGFFTSQPDKFLDRFNHTSIFEWFQNNPEDFFKVLNIVNNDPLLIRRSNIFYLLAEALQSDKVSDDLKQKIKNELFKFVKSDEDFFQFVKYYTRANVKGKRRFSTCLKKLIVNFYNSKEPMELVDCVTRQTSYHDWTHKGLFKLSHIKMREVLCEPIVSYVLYGLKQLSEGGCDGRRAIIDRLKKDYELRSSEDPSRIIFLIKDVKASVDQINSKFNKKEEVWLAALDHMTSREVLQKLYKFYKYGFLKSGSDFQAKVAEVLTNVENIKKCDLHPLQVFIYLKQFEKGGRPLDPKLIEFLKTKEIKEEVMTKIMSPNEPKNKHIIQAINKCLKLAYLNAKPTGKRIMVTIDVTEKEDFMCFHSKRISFLEAAIATVRFLMLVEKNVSVAVFKNSQINFVDIGKSYSAVEKLLEHKSDYIVPSAPIEWAKSKKKHIDVFINFMSCHNRWTSIPKEARDKALHLTDSLNQYSQKMQAPNTRVVRMYLGGPALANTETTKNIISIVGFGHDVPRFLESFCKGNFC